MSEKKKVCTYCQGRIKQYKSHPIINFTNIEQGSPYYFCSRDCKKAWIAERINKSQSAFKEWGRDEPIKKKLFDEAGNLKIKEAKPRFDKAENVKIEIVRKARCQYCKSEWPSNGSKVQHERWCDKNPNKRSYRSAIKASGILPKGDDFMAEHIGEPKDDITVKDLIVLGLDTKQLIKEFQRFFRNKDAILKSIDKLVERWEKEDSAL